jgi:hypothetical protein
MRYRAQRLGLLPHELVSRTLGMDLAPGRVYLSAAAHRHIAKEHPADYRMVISTLEAAIAQPTYLGQAPHQPDNFECIKRVTITEQDESGRVLHRYYVLIAICFEPDDHGDYRVVSGYAVKEIEVETRRQAGRLFPPKR